MSILADWFRRAMGKDRATLIGRDMEACGEMGRHELTHDEKRFLAIFHREHTPSSIMQAKFDAANERIAMATAMYRGREVPESHYAQACRARTKGWPQWKINFDLTAFEKSARASKGNRTRYAKRRAAGKDL